MYQISSKTIIFQLNLIHYNILLENKDTEFNFNQTFIQNSVILSIHKVHEVNE